MLRRYAASIIEQSPANRLLALDAFRGITITGMILVNNPGSWSYIYWPLAHAEWHGWTPTDLIFPFFIFIVGISMTLSIGVLRAKGFSNQEILKSSFIRTIKLIALGWVLALFFYNFTADHYNWVEERLLSMRVMGVLQRIGVVYFITVVAYLYLSKRFFYALAPILLVAYTVLMLFVPYSDNAGTTYVGLLENGNNFAAWIDSVVLTANHVYVGWTKPFAYDPEGILSTLPAIVTCISGVAVGQYLAFAKHHETSLIQQIKLLGGIGFLLTVLGLLMDPAFPINKILWTPSYVFLSSGIAIVCLAICLYVIDAKKYKLWTAPFIVFGANSIAFFMFAGIVGRIVVMVPAGETHLKNAIFTEFFHPLLGNYNGSLAYAIVFLCFSYVVFHYLYKKKLIWKV